MLASKTPFLALPGLLAAAMSAQATWVTNEEVLGDGLGGLGAIPGNEFGSDIATLDDLDGDGVIDVAIGAPSIDDFGRVWIVFLNTDGTANSKVEIGQGAGGFTGVLAPGDGFGDAVAPLGDLDGDGIVDLAVGASRDHDGGTPPFDAQGAVWILFLNADGTVKASQKISSTFGGFTGVLHPNASFGHGLAPLGDLDGDSVFDLAVGSPIQDGAQGAVWTLFLNTDGTVRDQREIAEGVGGFPLDSLNWSNAFGEDLDALGDVDGDGIVDLVVGAHLDYDGGFDPYTGEGAVWILFMKTDGTVSGVQKISVLAGGLTAPLTEYAFFGMGVAGTGDLDGDGTPDVAVSALRDLEGGLDWFTANGSIIFLFLDSGGSVKNHFKVSTVQGGFDGEKLGSAVEWFGDLDGDGNGDLAAGGIDGFKSVVNTLFLDDVPAPLAQIYGCGINPPGSLIVVSPPKLGSSLQLGLDNPLGTQSAPALSYLALSTGPDAAFPCGTPVPGFGMAGPGAAGELLLALAPPPFAVIAGPAWLGVGSPAPFDIPVPLDSMLIGERLYIQGLLIDPSAGPGSVRFGLTEAAELTLGH